MPGAQSVHCAAPGPEYVPPEHVSHVAAPGDAEKVPAVHGTQARVGDTALEPAGQMLHAVEPSCVAMEPASHVLHEVAPSCSAEYLPAGQGLHTVACVVSEYQPIAHRAGTTVPAEGQAAPTGQAMQPSSVVWALTGWYVPAAHWVQLEAPWGL